MVLIYIYADIRMMFQIRMPSGKRKSLVDIFYMYYKFKYCHYFEQPLNMTYAFNDVFYKLSNAYMEHELSLSEM